MRWTYEGNPGITPPNYWTVWSTARETGKIIVYIAGHGHWSEVHVGWAESVASRSSVIVILIGCMPGCSLKTQEEKLPFHFRFEEWASFSVLVPLSDKYVILIGCPRLPPVLTTESVSHPFLFLFYTRSVQTIFRPSVHRTNKSSLPAVFHVDSVYCFLTPVSFEHKIYRNK